LQGEEAAVKFIPLSQLQTFDPDSGELNAIIETPKGSRNKYDYDERQGVFKLGGVLPSGASFPFDFGFLPSTLGEDGDPLDVLVLMDEAAFAGCMVPVRLIGIVEAEQTERDGETMRNDRFIAVASNYRQQRDLHSLDDLAPTLMDEIEHFFVSYNSIKGKNFRPLHRSGPERAQELLKVGQKRKTAASKRKTAKPR
jgi:inorganic pyrophosphatase